MSEHVDIVKRTKRTESEKKPEIWMERINNRINEFN